MKWELIEQGFFNLHLQCKNFSSKAFILLEKEVDIPFLLISDPGFCPQKNAKQCKIHTPSTYSAVKNSAMT